jgi:glycosyltransferase involved in cell wall biosynthesis
MVSPATPSFIVSHLAEVSAASSAFFRRRDLLFFGGFWNPGSPNEDAVLYLAQRIMPLIWKVAPDVRLLIAGADPTPAVRNLACDRIHVPGYIADPREIFDRVRVHVAPMRFGAGIKLRLVETMAAGLPFVTTGVGAEGLPLDEMYAELVAETPRQIAERTLALYQDEAAWTHAHRTLRRIAEHHYGRATFQAALANALTAVGIVAPPAHADRPEPDARDLGEGEQGHAGVARQLQ